MDNASKALIMAGAILISVAIVGIGIYIFSTANALTDDAVGQIDSLAVSSANSRIENYCGFGVRGSSAIQLIREITVINNTNSFPNKISLTGITDETNITSNKKYDITVTGYDSNGYISTVNIANAK